jgi:hypothetical protein
MDPEGPRKKHPIIGGMISQQPVLIWVKICHTFDTTCMVKSSRNTQEIPQSSFGGGRKWSSLKIGYPNIGWFPRFPRFPKMRQPPKIPKSSMKGVPPILWKTPLMTVDHNCPIQNQDLEVFSMFKHTQPLTHNVGNPRCHVFNYHYLGMVF